MNLETMRLLVSKGLSAADLLEVAESMAVRVDKTAAERQARHRAKKAAGTDAVTRYVTRDSNGVTQAPLSRPPNEINSNPPTHTPENISRARKGTDFPMLDCTDAETWADFLRNRKTKRLPNTASAHRKLETDLAAMVARTGWPPGKLFAACVERGWGAIYDPRDKTDERNTRNTAGANLTAPNGRPMGRTEAAARAAAGMVSPGKPGGDHAGASALPDHRRAIGYVPG